MKFKFAACVISSALYSTREIQIYVKRDRKIRRNPIVSYDICNVYPDRYETLNKETYSDLFDRWNGASRLSHRKIFCDPLNVSNGQRRNSSISFLPVRYNPINLAYLGSSEFVDLHDWSTFLDVRPYVEWTSTGKSMTSLFVHIEGSIQYLFRNINFWQIV